MLGALCLSSWEWCGDDISAFVSWILYALTRIGFALEGGTIIDRKNAPPPGTTWSSVRCGYLP